MMSNDSSTSAESLVRAVISLARRNARRGLSALFWSGLTFVCATGCHTAPPLLNTASGRPEVIIQGKSGRQIQQVALAFFVKRGYAVRPSDHEDKLIFDRRTEKPGAAASISNCWRVRVTIVNLNENTSHRLSGTPCKVDDCGADLESEQVMPIAFPQIQGFLEEIKRQLELVK